MPNKEKKGGGDQLFSDTPSEKELSQCYVCEAGLQKFNGGGMKYATIDAEKNNTKYRIDVFYGNKYDLSMENLKTNRKSVKKCKNMKELRETLANFSINNYKIAK